MKRPLTKLSFAIEPALKKLLDEGGYNKSKLVNMLLVKYLKDLPKKK